MTDNNKTLKLNLGCGSRPLPGYLNIDLDSLASLKKRYPEQKFPKGIKIYQYNILKLPFSNNSIDEVKADSLIEHLSFIEEPKFFKEVQRVLKEGGIFEFSTTDFEKIVKLWLDAKDDWQNFFSIKKKDIAKNHWFGTYTYDFKNRWGYICASIFGSQNGSGQFHKNCYTKKKIIAVLEHLGMKIEKITSFRWKKDRDPMIFVRALKLK